MRILFVNQYFPPDVSATAYLLGELSEDLARDHSVRVVVGRPSYNPEAGLYRPRAVRVDRAWSTAFRRGGMPGRLLNYGSFVLTSLARAASGPKPDVVVAMTDPPVIGMIGLLAARRYRVPFVYVCEDIFPEVGIALGRVDNPIVVWLLRRLNRRLRRAATMIVAIGRDMQEKLERDGVPAGKIEFIPNWGSDYAVDQQESAGVRHSLGWGDRFVVIHGGNVGLAQNLEVVIDAAERLRSRPEILIAFVGDGAAKRHLERSAQRRRLSNITFLPYQPKTEAQLLLATADLHLVSLAPGLTGSVVPSKVYGILALGRPFVAAVEDGSEVARIIDESQAGLRVEPGDAVGMADAIARFADGTVDVKEAGRRARLEFDLKYRREIATERYRDVLESVASADPYGTRGPYGTSDDGALAG
ncbi:MAG: glycosyltransferase family 4 protein [Actinomycetota bacterium]